MRNILIILLLILSLNAKDRFEVKEQIVIDSFSGLMWQKATGMKNITWSGAIRYCKKIEIGGYADWKAPSIDELMSLIDKNGFKISINTKYFPDTIESFYWTSSIDKNDKSRAWLVFFDSGFGDHSYKDRKGHIRCVRSSKK